MEGQLGGALFDPGERHLVEEGNGIVAQLSPAAGVEVAKKGDGILVPAPPDVARDAPEAFLQGCNKAREGARLAYGCGLHDEDALQDAAINEGDAEEGLVSVLVGLFDVLKAGMVLYLAYGDGVHLFCDQAGEAFMESEAQRANAGGAEAHGGGEDEIGAVGFEEIDGADIRMKVMRDELDHAHEGLGRLAGLLHQLADLFQSKDTSGIQRFCSLGHGYVLRFR